MPTTGEMGPMGYRHGWMHGGMEPMRYRHGWMHDGMGPMGYRHGWMREGMMRRSPAERCLDHLARRVAMIAYTVRGGIDSLELEPQPPPALSSSIFTSGHLLCRGMPAQEP